MSEQSKSLVFAFVLCLACSLLLTAAATGLKQRQVRNVLVDRHRNILLAVGLIEEGRHTDAARVESMYREKIKELWVDSAGAIVPPERRGPGDLPIYVYCEGESVEAYVIPIDTRGLWGEINGYLAIDKDGSTIRGFTVYSHSETPGLGGEIERSWFRKKFVGKRITDRQGRFVSISIAKGSVAQVVPEPRRINYVDGISGATMTGRFLTSGFRDILRNYEPVAVRFRQGILNGPESRTGETNGQAVEEK